MGMIPAILMSAVLAGPGQWSSFETGRFTVLYAPSSLRLAQEISRELEPRLDRAAAFLATEPPEKITVMVAPDQPSFSRSQGGLVAPWVSGMAYPDRSLIVLRPLSGAEVRHSGQGSVITHELTHLALHHKLRGHEPPRWLDEGVAVFLGDDPFYARAERLMAIAVTGRNIPFRHLQDEFPASEAAAATAYAESGDFVRFLINEHGRDRFLHYLDLLAAGQDPDQALIGTFNASLFDLEEKWLKKLRRSYGLIPALTGGTLLWFLISLLAVVAYLRKRAEARTYREPGMALYARDLWREKDLPWSGAEEDLEDLEEDEDDEDDEDEDEEDEEYDPGSPWQH